jgi:hypothetical protein
MNKREEFEKALEDGLPELPNAVEMWSSHDSTMRKVPAYGYTADQMLAYGDQCRAVGQWIACSERLPEQDAEVLAYCPDHECHAAWFDQDVFKVSKPTNYASGQYEDWDSDKPVTHWMPLPPVPEAK